MSRNCAAFSKSCEVAAFFISASSCSFISFDWPSRKSHAGSTCIRYCSRVTLPMHGAVQTFSFVHARVGLGAEFGDDVAVQGHVSSGDQLLGLAAGSETG